jgi:hypothetical protein
MTPIEYPVDVRADYPERSSRLWAVLTIFWIKFFAIIPHAVILVFLGIAQWVVAFIAQFVVAFKGEYPAGMHEFVTGVLRWQTRVAAFVLSVNDRYPPFSLRQIDDYPLDVVAERPSEPSRAYAAFTIIVQILAVAGGIWLAVWLIGHADTFTSTSQNGNSSFRRQRPVAAPAGCDPALHRPRLRRDRSVRHLVRRAVGDLVRGQLPAWHVGHRGRLRALVHAGERLRPGTRRPVPAVLDEPVALGRRTRRVRSRSASSAADDGDMARSAGAAGPCAAAAGAATAAAARSAAPGGTSAAIGIGLPEPRECRILRCPGTSRTRVGH